MGCRRLRTNDIKELAERKIESGEYDEARAFAFTQEFEDFMQDYIEKVSGNFKTITEDDLQGFLESFEFPEEDEWAVNSVIEDYESYCEDQADMARDEAIMESR